MLSLYSEYPFFFPVHIRSNMRVDAYEEKEPDMIRLLSKKLFLERKRQECIADGN